MISAIVACDANFGIGNKGELLFHIPADLKRFKALTEDGVVIMGRKTWDSLPKKPLPNRRNIVISHWKPISDVGAEFMALEEVEELLYYYGKLDNFFIIGGEQIYQELMKWCDKIYLTAAAEVYSDVDAWFPIVAAGTNWKRTNISEPQHHDGMTYYFITYERI